MGHGAAAGCRQPCAAAAGLGCAATEPSLHCGLWALLQAGSSPPSEWILAADRSVAQLAAGREGGADDGVGRQRAADACLLLLCELDSTGQMKRKCSPTQP